MLACLPVSFQSLPPGTTLKRLFKMTSGLASSEPPRSFIQEFNWVGSTDDLDAMQLSFVYNNERKPSSCSSLSLQHTTIGMRTPNR